MKKFVFRRKKTNFLTFKVQPSINLTQSASNAAYIGNTGNNLNIQLPSSSHIKLEQGVASMLNGIFFKKNI